MIERAQCRRPACLVACAALAWLIASSGCASVHPASVHPAPAKPKPPREPICSELYEHSRMEPEATRLFGNVASAAGTPRHDWREFRSEEEREAARRDDNLNELADVWTLADRGDLVRMLFTTPSGDWMEYVDYCYRADGTLAMIDSELRSFAGGIVVTRTQAYDFTGKRSAESVEYSDLFSEQPTDENGPEGKGFEEHEAPPYSTERELPFWSLMARGAAR